MYVTENSYFTRMDKKSMFEEFEAITLRISYLLSDRAFKDFKSNSALLSEINTALIQINQRFNGLLELFVENRIKLIGKSVKLNDVEYLQLLIIKFLNPRRKKDTVDKELASAKHILTTISLQIHFWQHGF